MRLFFTLMLPLTCLLPGSFATAQEAEKYGLEQAMEDMAAKSPLLFASQANMEAAEARVDEQRGALWPTLTAGAGYEKINAYGGVVPYPFSYRNSSWLSLDQPLFTGGGILYGLEAMKHQKSMSAQACALTYNNLALKTVAYYLDALAFGEILLWYQQSLDKLSSSGSSPSEQDRWALSSMEKERDNYKSRLDLAILRLGQMVGSNATLPLQWPDKLPSIPSTLQEAVDQALSAHPSILIARANQMSSQASLKQTKSRLWPRVYASVSYKSHSPDSFYESPYEQGVIYGINTSINLFEGGRTESAIREQNAKVREATFMTEDTKNTIRNEVELDWLALGQTTATLEKVQANWASVQAQDSAQEDASATTGKTNAQAERVSLDALVSLTNAKRNYLLSVYGLAESIGTFPERSICPAGKGLPL